MNRNNFFVTINLILCKDILEDKTEVNYFLKEWIIYLDQLPYFPMTSVVLINLRRMEINQFFVNHEVQKQIFWGDLAFIWLSNISESC